MTTYRTARAGWLAAAAVLAAGCGAGEKPAGTVAGTVTYNGAPVQAGSLNLLSRTGAAAQAKLGDGGAFKVDGELEAGEYRAYLSAPVPEPQPPGTRVAAAKKFEVPAKFQDPATSVTTVTVKAGANDLKVEFQ
jgi:hypothetical protein